MNVLMDIFILVGILAFVCFAWWAMIEAQTRIPGVNEPSMAALHNDDVEKAQLIEELVDKWIDTADSATIHEYASERLADWYDEKCTLEEVRKTHDYECRGVGEC